MGLFVWVLLYPHKKTNRQRPARPAASRPLRGKNQPRLLGRGVSLAVDMFTWPRMGHSGVLAALRGADAVTGRSGGSPGAYLRNW